MKYPAKLKSIQTVLATHKIQSLIENPIYLKQIVFSDLIILNYLVQ